jgi:hypothetical protein
MDREQTRFLSHRGTAEDIYKTATVLTFTVSECEANASLQADFTDTF